MNRKDKTVKQLQAECRKRKVGFMMNWTKVALTKRLEDEDKRELASKKVEDKATKEMNKAKKELESAKIQHSNYISKRDAQYDQNLLELQKSDPKAVEKQIKEKMVKAQEKKIKTLRSKLTGMKEDQDQLIQRSNAIARESIELVKEIQALEFSIVSLK